MIKIPLFIVSILYCFMPSSGIAAVSGSGLTLVQQAQQCKPSSATQIESQRLSKCFEDILGHPQLKQNPFFYTQFLSNYANTLVIEGQYAKAMEKFSAAKEIAHNHDYDQLIPGITGNMGITTTHLKQYDESFKLIQSINLEAVETDFQKAQIQLQLIDILISLLRYSDLDKVAIANLLYQHSENLLQDKQLSALFRSKALLNKAYLYQYNHQFQDAENLYLQALDIAQQKGLTRSVINAQWKLAQLYKIWGRIQDSVTGYALAIKELESSKSVSTMLHNDRALNQQPLSQLYIEYADLLLTTSIQLNEGQQKQQQLQTARRAIERSKAAQLQDYFKDECVAQTRQKVQLLDTVLSKNSAVLYPVVFENRVELLLSTANHIQQFSITIDREIIKKAVDELRIELEKRKSRGYLRSARQLYSLLIKPIEQTLEDKQINTLINVPGYGLLGVPFAALHDGQQFLVEKVALAISPGLELTLTEGLSSEQPRHSILLSGLSEPVQGFDALYYVEKELNTINQQYQSDILLNNNFKMQSFADALYDRQLSIVHIATHAEFSDNIHQSFLLAHDQKISVNQLSEYIGFNRFRDNPLDLLTLSACYTAAGNEKAALGIAGITVKSGARSALATLWPVNDKATALLMEQFYQGYEAGTGKARALRLAQLSLLDKIHYRHPGYWASFVIIGNWL